MKRITLFILGMALAGGANAATGVVKVSATSASSSVAGILIASDTPKGLAIRGTISGLTPGQHGFHVHEFGDCSDTGKAAGSHYNPGGHQHGNALRSGNAPAHAGDMGNLEADEKGNAAVDVVLPGVTLTGTAVSTAGRAVIVHEKADDFGQPVGNAGGRVGCGAFIITGN